MLWDISLSHRDGNLAGQNRAFRNHPRRLRNEPAILAGNWCSPGDVGYLRSFRWLHLVASQGNESLRTVVLLVGNRFVVTDRPVYAGSDTLIALR